MNNNNLALPNKGISKNLLLFFCLLGICGLLIFAFNHKTVFPSAAINLSVTKADILKLAETISTQYGYNKPSTIKSITFGCDDDAKTFLEYELGNKTANELMQKEVPVFYWYCGFKKEFDQEKMLMTISPQGELFYFDHVFPNDLAIKDIDHAEARAKAYAYMLKHTSWAPADCKLVEDNLDKQIHRNDYDFIWENQKSDWKGAKLRASVSYCGNILSGYYKYLKLPESWERRYQTIRSYNNLLQTIATIFYSLLHIGAAFIFFRAITQGELRWRFVLISAAILTTICFLENSNDLASTLSLYDPHKSYSAFLAMTAFSLVGGLPFSFIGIAIIVGAAERIYRWAFPDKLPMPQWFSLSALRSRYMITALILGYATFGISIGYQILYYALGDKLHFWCPLGVDKYEILTAAQPWFSAFTLGVFASGAEELLYRVIMLGVGQKILKRFWLANILQAMAWGFMHSSYPQQPAYARGIELTFEGIFWGWILKRFGLLPCLVSHYLFDVFCDSVPLLSAKMLSLRLSVFIPLLLFAVLGIVGAWLRYKKGDAVEDNYSESEAIKNAGAEAAGKTGADKSSAGVSASTSVGTSTGASAGAAFTGASVGTSSHFTDNTPYIYQPLAKAVRLALASILLVCLAVSFYWQEPKYEIYQNAPVLTTSRQAAIQIAHDYLVKNHFDLNGYMSAANCDNGLVSHKENYQYVFEKAGFDGADKIAHEIEHPQLWTVRYFKPGCAEEYTISIDADGKVLWQTIEKEEDAPGAKLTEAEAKKIAEDYLRHYGPIYVPFVFSDVQVTNEKNRTDYAFQFKCAKYKIAEADLIIAVNVVGDIPSYQGHYWNVPDEWKWAKAKITLAKALAMIALAVLAIGCFIAFAWWTVSLFIARVVRWRLAIVPAIIFLVSTISLLLNYIPASFVYYQTTMPIPTYLVLLAVGGGLIAVSAGASMIFSFVLSAAALGQLGFTKQTVFTLRNLAPWLKATNKKEGFDFWLDAILLAGAYGIFFHLFSVAEITLGHSLNHSVLIEPLTIFHGAVNSFWPVITEINMTLTSIFTAAIFLAIFIGVLAKFGIKKDWQILLLIFGTSALGSMSTVFSASDFHWQESLFYFVFGVIGTLLYWFFLRKAVQRNMLSLLIWLFFSQMFGSVKEMIACGCPLFANSIVLMSVFALLPLGYLGYLKINSGRK